MIKEVGGIINESPRTLRFDNRVKNNLQVSKKKSPSKTSLAGFKS